METVNKTVTESSLRGPATEGSEAVQDRSGNRAVETTRKPVSPITGKGLPVILGRDGKPLRGVALLAKLGKHPRPTLGQTWTWPWVGEWGDLKNGLSKLSKLAKRIEKEIMEGYEPLFSPLQRRLIRAAAEYGALAEQARASFGIDPTVTRRTITVLTRGFQHYLANLETLGGLKRRNRAPADLPGTLRQLSEGQK